MAPQTFYYSNTKHICICQKIYRWVDRLTYCAICHKKSMTEASRKKHAPSGGSMDTVIHNCYFDQRSSSSSNEQPSKFCNQHSSNIDSTFIFIVWCAVSEFYTQSQIDSFLTRNWWNKIWLTMSSNSGFNLVRMFDKYFL